MTITNRSSSVARGEQTIPYTRKLRVVIALPGGVEDNRDVRIIARVLADFQLEVTCTELDQTPEEIVETVLGQGAEALALPILSATHLALLPRIAELLQDGGIHDICMTLGEPSPVREIRGSSSSPRWAPSPFTPPREVIASIESHLGPVPAQAIGALRSTSPVEAIWVFFALSPDGYRPA